MTVSDGVSLSPKGGVGAELALPCSKSATALISAKGLGQRPSQNPIWNILALKCDIVVAITNDFPDNQLFKPCYQLTSSDIVASLSLATSRDCRTAPQHIKPYSLTSTSHSVVFPILPGVVGLVAHVADGSTESETTPADLWRQALGRGHHGRATRRSTLAMQ